MYIYTYKYMCVYVCIYVCMYVCMYVCIYIYIYKKGCAREITSKKYSNIYIYIYIHERVCVRRQGCVRAIHKKGCVCAGQRARILPIAQEKAQIRRHLRRLSR